MAAHKMSFPEVVASLRALDEARRRLPEKVKNSPQFSATVKAEAVGFAAFVSAVDSARASITVAAVEAARVARVSAWDGYNSLQLCSLREMFGTFERVARRWLVFNHRCQQAHESARLAIRAFATWEGDPEQAQEALRDAKTAVNGAWDSLKFAEEHPLSVKVVFGDGELTQKLKAWNVDRVSTKFLELTERDLLDSGLSREEIDTIVQKTGALPTESGQGRPNQRRPQRRQEGAPKPVRREEGATVAERLDPHTVQMLNSVGQENARRDALAVVRGKLGALAGECGFELTAFCYGPVRQYYQRVADTLFRLEAQDRVSPTDLKNAREALAVLESEWAKVASQPPSAVYLIRDAVLGRLQRLGKERPEWNALLSMDDGHVADLTAQCVTGASEAEIAERREANVKFVLTALSFARRVSQQGLDLVSAASLSVEELTAKGFTSEEIGLVGARLDHFRRTLAERKARQNPAVPAEPPVVAETSGNDPVVGDDAASELPVDLAQFVSPEVLQIAQEAAQVESVMHQLAEAQTSANGHGQNEGMAEAEEDGEDPKRRAKREGRQLRADRESRGNGRKEKWTRRRAKAAAELEN